jgi:hypothetical protein
MTQPRIIGAALVALALSAVPVQAQFNGSHNLGDFGLQSGSQPAAGLYLAGFFYDYDTETIKNRTGDSITVDSNASLGIRAFAPILWYVSKAKLLGANYGVMAVVPIARGSLDAPALGASSGTGTSLSDIYLRPVDLGWHKPRADVTAGLGVYIPSGKYEFSGSENTGKGMWTGEPYGGATLYLDQKRTVSVATTAYWELHGKKKDTDITVGQILSLQGGAGKSFLGGGLIIGAAYYAQWKLTHDEVGDGGLPGAGRILNPELASKHQVFGIGPDVTLPLASRSTLFALLNIRYLWETGATTKTEGQSLVVMATFPVPSLKLR